MNRYFTKERGHVAYPTFSRVCFGVFVVKNTSHLESFLFFFIKNTTSVEEGAHEQKTLLYFFMTYAELKSRDDAYDRSNMLLNKYIRL